MKEPPFYAKFGFKVFLFNALVVSSMAASLWIAGRRDYKALTDRIASHSSFFDWASGRLSALRAEDWPAAVEAMPGLLDRQRVCVFGLDGSLIHDSGIMRNYAHEFSFRTWLPHPYADWSRPGIPFDPAVYLRFLRSIDTDGLDPGKLFRRTCTVAYPQGLDRVIVSGILVESSDGERLVLTLGSGLSDMLIHERAVKERLLLVYSLVALLTLALTFLLSRSVTRPLKRLYRRSAELLSAEEAARVPEPPSGRSGMFPAGRGEIDAICRAMLGLMADLKRQAESFSRFSSDIVHELRTPLAAIRSGLEVHAELEDGAARAEIIERVNRRISRMEGLMDEIRLIGRLETERGAEECDDVEAVCRDALAEFRAEGVRADLGPGLSGRAVAVSAQRLFQALSNLLRNAADFSPSRGSVVLSARADAGGIALTVADRGPGIRPEIFEHLAKRFFSYRSEESEKHSGLGLSIVELIAESGGGRLEYRNREEGGAEFGVRLPWKRPG
jgi:signal transduction histidine kinase